MMSYKAGEPMVCRVVREGRARWEPLSTPELYDHEWITPVLCRQTFPRKYNVLIKSTKQDAKTK